MKIKVKFYGFVQLIIGKVELELEFPASSSLEDVWNYLLQTYPQLKGQDIKKMTLAKIKNETLEHDEWAKVSITQNESIEFYSLLAGG